MLNISQSYCPPRPLMGIALVFLTYVTHRLYISSYVYMYGYENVYLAVDYLLSYVSLEVKL
jgi:hypothetical protein